MLLNQHTMNIRIQLREILAWITLLIAIVLFSVSVSFAQVNTVSVMNKNGKIEVKVESETNGKIVKSDTSFTIKDEKDLDKIVDAYVDAKSGNQSNKKQSSSDSKNNKEVKKKKIIIDLDVPEISEKEKEEINEEIRNAMNEVENSLHEAYNSLKKLHIHIDTDEDFKGDENKSQVHVEKHFKREGEHGNEEIDHLRDSLSDNHFIILGDENETAPTLEKVMTSKSGKKVFVYRKSGTISKSDKAINKIEKGMDQLTIYPNPSNGKLSVKFVSDNKEDIAVKILDEYGKTVWNEKEIEFNGEYSKEIDFTSFNKGVYIVKVSQGKRTVSEKLILN